MKEKMRSTCGKIEITLASVMVSVILVLIFMTVVGVFLNRLGKKAAELEAETEVEAEVAEPEIMSLSEDDLRAMGKGVHWTIHYSGPDEHHLDEAGEAKSYHMTKMLFANQGGINWIEFYVINGRIRTAKLGLVYPVMLSYVDDDIYESYAEDEVRKTFQRVNGGAVAEVNLNDETIQLNEEQLELLKKTLAGEASLADTEIWQFVKLGVVNLTEYLAACKLEQDEAGIYWADATGVGVSLGVTEYNGDQFLQPTFYRRVYSGSEEEEEEELAYTLREYRPSDTQCMVPADRRLLVQVPGYGEIYTVPNILLGLEQCMEMSSERYFYMLSLEIDTMLYYLPGRYDGILFKELFAD